MMRMCLSLMGVGEWSTAYFCFPPSPCILESLSSLISLETVAWVTLKPASLRRAASSSWVSISYFPISSTILLCLSSFIDSSYICVIFPLKLSRNETWLILTMVVLSSERSTVMVSPSPTSSTVSPSKPTAWVMLPEAPENSIITW